MFFNSDSEDACETFTPAVLNRPSVANYIVHESFTVDTQDHEDHTFCGVMFDVGCRGVADGGVPIEFMEIDAIAVRGDLGPLTVWTAPGGYARHPCAQEAWELVYERSHTPSNESYQRLELTRSIRLCSGESCGLYVHSKLPGDDAIVYDNCRGRVTYENEALRVLPGKAHLSCVPFGSQGMWGFGWRDRREFVGQISYGVSYVLWNPIDTVHERFPLDFRRAAKALLLCARRPTCPLYWLTDAVIFYILNMCRHDWFNKPAQRPAEQLQPRLQLGAQRNRAVWHASQSFVHRSLDANGSGSDSDWVDGRLVAAGTGSFSSSGSDSEGFDRRLVEDTSDEEVERAYVEVERAHCSGAHRAEPQATTLVPSHPAPILGHPQSGNPHDGSTLQHG